MLRDCGPNRYKTLTIPVAPALQKTSIDKIQDKRIDAPDAELELTRYPCS